MTRIALALTMAGSLTVASCVPASEAAPPAGALGFVAEPSPATRGEPFVTSDGWTIRIEQFVLQVRVSTSSKERGAKRPQTDSSETYRFDARKTTGLFARATPAGLASATLRLDGTYIDSGKTYDADTEVLGVSPEVNARFRVRSDAPRSDYAWPYGPTMFLTLRAKRADRVVIIDLALLLDGGTDPFDAPERNVVADTLVTMPIAIAAEALFVEDETRDLRFDDFAAADVNDDGILTGPELGAAVCRSCEGRQRLNDKVRGRGFSVFVTK